MLHGRASTGELSAFVARELSARFTSCSGGGGAADKRVLGALRAQARRSNGAPPQAPADGGGGGALLGRSGRQSRQLLVRYDEEGPEGLRLRFTKRLGSCMPEWHVC